MNILYTLLNKTKYIKYRDSLKLLIIEELPHSIFTGGDMHKPLV